MDTQFILSLFSTNEQIAKEELEKHARELNKDICLEYEEKHHIRDDELLDIIEKNGA